MSRFASLFSQRVPLYVWLPIVLACAAAGFIASTLRPVIPGVGRMGTRHRAAVRLTLQSDAVVLIVSEETGLISVANEGRITRGLDAKALRGMLITLTGAEAPHRQGIMPRPAVLRAIRRRTHP